MWSSLSSFSIHYAVVFLKSSSSCLRLLPRLRVTSILPSISPSITCFRRQFLRKMWRIQLVILCFIVFRIFRSSFWLCNTSFFTWSVQPIFSSLLQHHISKLSRYFWYAFRSVQISAPRSVPYVALHLFLQGHVDPFKRYDVINKSCLRANPNT
jgi:hypothetical protein